MTELIIGVLGVVGLFTPFFFLIYKLNKITKK